MIKIIHTIILLLLILSNCFAQNFWKQNLGINYTTLSKSDNKLQTGWVYGLEHTWKLNKQLSLFSGGLLNIMRGSLLDETSRLDDYVILKKDVNYVMVDIFVPLCVSFHIYEREDLHIHLNSGVGFNINVYNQIKGKSTKHELLTTEQVDRYPVSLPFASGEGSAFIENSGFSSLAGFGLGYYVFDLQFLYSFSLHKENLFDQYLLDRRSGTLIIMLGIKMN